MSFYRQCFLIGVNSLLKRVHVFFFPETHNKTDMTLPNWALGLIITAVLLFLVLVVSIPVALRRGKTNFDKKSAKTHRQEAIETQKWVQEHNLTQEFESRHSRVSSDVLARGKHIVSESSIVVCGLVRDLGYCLTSSLTRMRKLTEGFHKVHFVFYENDSKDNSVRLLQRFQDKLGSSRVTILTEKLGLGETKTKGQWESKMRYDKMAMFRNKIIQFLRTKNRLAQYDYVLWHDMDALGGVSRKGFLDTLAASETWDMVCAYAIDATVLRTKGKEHMYDTLAYRDAKGQRVSTDVSLHWDKAGRRPWVKITSGFNGLAIYKACVFAQCEYAGGDCEHIALHDAMIRQGFKRMYMNLNLKMLL